MRRLKVVTLMLCFGLAPGALARGTGSHAGHAPRSTRCASCARDSKGHIARNARSVQAFKKSHPCPSTGKTSGACPGYVIDHIQPLKRGGVDSPGNMQWQTKAAAKAKDKVE
jgi:hypothetical protein